MPVSLIASTPEVLATLPNNRASNLQAFAQRSKRKPVSYVTAGVGRPAAVESFCERSRSHSRNPFFIRVVMQARRLSDPHGERVVVIPSSSGW